MSGAADTLSSSTITDFAVARRLQSSAAVALAVAYGAVCLAAVIWTRFHVGLNDFWGNVALAQMAEGGRAASFYSPFFPAGYTAFLKTAGTPGIVPAHLLNIACGVVLLIVVWRLGRSFLEPQWTLAAMAWLALDPQIFRYVTTPGPDLPAATMAAVGFLVVFPTDRPSSRRLIIGGAILGIAALMRYHGLVFGGLAILATAVGQRHMRRHVWLAGGGFLLVYAVQMVVAISAGHTPLHTGQAYIFYKLVHAVNWFHPVVTPMPTSALGVVLDDPRAFAAAYWRQCVALSWMLMPVVVLSLVARAPEAVRFARLSLFMVAAYLVVVATGGSSRGSLPVHFLVALAIAGTARMAVRRPVRPIRIAATILVTIAAAVWGVSALRQDWGTTRDRARAQHLYRQVASTLEHDGIHAASQVFASDFSLYFPTVAGQAPRVNGGWLRVDNDPYLARHPDLCVTSTACFLADARRMGVTHVVFTQEVRDLSTALEAIYLARGGGEFAAIADHAPYRVFRIQPSR